MPRSCLIVIDMQNDFLDKLEERSRMRLIARCNELIDTCRAAQSPVIWITTSFKPDLSDAFLEMRDRQIAAAIEGTTGAALDVGLERCADEHVIAKKRYSAFFGTELDELLRRTAPDFLILAGVNTHACVRTTAIDAYQRDLRVILASECVDSMDPEHARMSLAYMDGKIATLMTNDQIAATIARNGKAGA